MHRTLLVSLLLTLVTPSVALAHGGGLDALGCHHNRSAGGYHCHRGPLDGRSFSSKVEAERALAARSSTSSSATQLQSSTLPVRSTPTTKSAASDSADLIKAAQHLLTALGYEPGAIDGNAGPQTIDAARRFRADLHLPANGEFDMTLLVELSGEVRRRGVR